MSNSEANSELIKFPCHFEFKAFGPGDDESFLGKVQMAVSVVVPLSREAMKTRASSGGKYQCISAMVSVQNRTQLEAIYSQLRTIDGLKYML